MCLHEDSSGSLSKTVSNEFVTNRMSGIEALIMFFDMFGRLKARIDTVESTKKIQ